MEQRYEDDEIEIDLRELFFVWLSKIWMIMGVTLAGIIAAILVTTLCITPMYQSTASLYILSKSTSLTSLADIQLGTQLTKDYMVIARSHTVVDEVLSELDLDMTYEQFLSHVSISNDSDTRILSLTVQNPDPYMAKTIVDTYAAVTAKQTAAIMETDTPNNVDVGVVPIHPVSPSLKKNALIGGGLAFVLVLAIIALLHIMNDSVKTVDDVEKYLGLTNLGSIPLYEDSKAQKKKRSKKNSKTAGKSEQKQADKKD